MIRAATPLLALLTVACGLSDPVGPPDILVQPQPPRGPSLITVAVATAGTAFDSDGFTVLLDGDSVATVDVDGSVALLVEPGMHRFELGSLAPNCSTTGTVTTSVPANSSRTVRLTASCVAPGELPVMRILVQRSSRLVAMNTDGTDQVVLLSNEPIATPDVSGDGRRMVYVQRAEVGYRDLWVADVDGANRARLVSGVIGASPRWSPDGQRIAYNAFEGVSLVRPDGTGRSTWLSAWMIPDFAFYSGPAWSPDGTRIVVTFGTFDGGSRGMLIASLEGDMDYLNPSVVPVGWLAWSVDDLIAYVAEDGAMMVIRPDGTGETTLIAGSEGAAAHPQDWSPGGAWLLYTDRGPFGGTDLYLMSPVDGVPIRMTATGDVASASFLPDVAP